MKKILIILSVLFLTTACNKDWMDTKPTGSTASSNIFGTTKNAYLALNGIGRLMVAQYFSVQGFNGEGTIKMYLGNYVGNHFVKEQVGWSDIMNLVWIRNSTTQYNYYMWYYYYKLIGDANAIYENIDGAQGPENEIKDIKAKALCYRAYSYMMLSQIYCKRWQDSNNGASEGLVLRLSADEGDDAPLSTLAEVFVRVYDDLDEAIKLFDESKIPRAANCDMSIDVAYAIYARAALVRNDWQTAATMANKAKAQYPLMSNSELLNGGFYTPNSEWIWSSAGSTSQNLYYYSYHAYIAYNSNASAVRSYPALITKELYAKIPDTDVRRNWWLYYKDLPIGRTTNAAILAEVRAKYPKLDGSAYIANYMQFKIACEVGPGVGHLNHFRSSEMYLIEAEALARLNRPAEAQAVMNSLNRDSGRNPSYSCTATGQALLDEIWLYRDVELWGEGFDWFDLKRTKRGIDRSNKDNGGSYLSALAVKIDPDKINDDDIDYFGWVWIIPVRETDYNPGI